MFEAEKGYAFGHGLFYCLPIDHGRRVTPNYPRWPNQRTFVLWVPLVRVFTGFPAVKSS